MNLERICILIPALNPGGAEKQSILLARALQENYRVTLVVQKGSYVYPDYQRYIMANEIRLLLLKGSVLRRLFLFYSFLKKEDIHIIFSYLSSSNLWSGIIGKWAGVDYLVGGIRSLDLPLIKHFITKMLHLYILDFVLFNSYAGFQAFLHKGFLQKKSYVINNFVEISTEPVTRPERDIIKILTVARFVYQKDYYTAIKAFHYLLENLYCGTKKIEYTIIGFGKLEKQIREWIDEFGLSENIQTIIRPDNIKDYYFEADIYLSTSVVEGFSNSIMEAMLYSLPVIATDVGDNKKLVRNGITGFLTPVADYRTIGLKMNELVLSTEKRNNFGIAAYKLIGEKFSMDKIRKDYLVFIELLDH